MERGRAGWPLLGEIRRAGTEKVRVERLPQQPEVLVSGRLWGPQ